MPPNPPAVVAAPVRVMCTKNQLVDESALQYREHNVKSMYEGEEGLVVDGDLQNGLPPPYTDYVEIAFSDGRRGKVSRYVLKLV